MARMRIRDEDIRDADILETVLANFPDVVHSVDSTGKLVFTNKKEEELLGYTREELLSMNVRDLYAAEDIAGMQLGFEELKKIGDRTVEGILKAKDGTKIPVEIRSFAIYDDEGNFARTFSILRDIRPIKQAARLATIGEMASGIAHDIKNPLTAVSCYNEMIIRALDMAEENDTAPDMEQIRSFAIGIADASRFIEALSTRIQNFVKGRQDGRSKVDLHAVIIDSLFLADNRIKKNGVVVRNTVVAETCYTTASPTQLTEVFLNLVSNGCDAMGEGSTKELGIAVSGCERDGEKFWCCKVSDTGSGIKEEDQKVVFQSFFTTKERDKGTGLGLAITRGIVESHGGTIEFESAQAKGTTFSVYLPVS